MDHEKPNERLRQREVDVMAVVGLAHDQDPDVALQVLESLCKVHGYDLLLTGGSGNGTWGRSPASRNSEMQPTSRSLAESMQAFVGALESTDWEPKASKVWLGHEVSNKVLLEPHEWGIWSFPERDTHISAVQVPQSVVDFFFRQLAEREPALPDVDRG